ncbi:outer membrane beta-barrel protein [Helicobacter suis]|uniref:outer membrane beta-barrel protein n=1 Tax=Helicobacter suis TaxID=104628 RepID=UPI0023DD778A|nr:outer membrane beta-barrel protein [Helicobacter suis]
MFNLGFRAQLSRHNGIELGVRIPTIDNPYYTYSSPKENAAWGVAGASKTTIRFRRNVAAYLNYVYHF